MPFRPQQLDTGFTGYLPPEEQPGPPLVPLRYDETLLASSKAKDEIFGAAFRQENDVLNFINLVTRPQYTPDPDFDLAGKLKADGLWNDYSENFLGVQSEAEYNAVAGRIAQETRDRETLANAGTAGAIAAMSAGMLSPTALLPLVGEARGVKALALGVSLGLAGGVAQEVPLQLAQETRTLDESVSSIAMSAVVGGVLGGAIAFARRSPQEIVEGMRGTVDDMAQPPGGPAIPETTATGRPTSVGAKARLEEAPELASAFGVEKGPLARISPVLRTLNSPFAQARRMMALLSDAGVRFKNGAIGAVGGTVENRIRTHWGPLAVSFGDFDRLFAQYMLGKTDPSLIERARLRLPGRAVAGKLSRKEFREAVGEAMFTGDTHPIPEVQEAVKIARELIYDPLYKLAQESGVLAKANAGGEVGLGDDPTYLNRLYNQNMIEARQSEFEAIIAKDLNERLMEEFRRRYASFAKRQRRGADRVSDFRLSAEEANALREQFEQELLQVEGGRSAELVELENAVSDKRTAARALDRGTPERELLNEEARELEAQGGEEFVALKERRADIRARLRNLRRNHSALAERQQKKLDRIERSEELSFGTLQRLIRKGQKALTDILRVSDERLDEELSDLRTSFAQAAERFDKNEARIAKIFDDEFEEDVPTSPFLSAARSESAAFDKMTDAAERLDDLETLDRESSRLAVQAYLDEATRRAQGIVERRAVRNARLAQQAADLDPENAAKQIEALQAQLGDERLAFLDEWREQGADDIDPATGQADFKRFSLDAAHIVTDHILGTNVRLPGMDIILQPRGAELARALAIDSGKLRSAVDGRSFLETDIEKAATAYVRTLAPDIELARALGEFAPDMGRNLEFQKLNDEVRARRAQIEELMGKGIDPDTGKEYAGLDPRSGKRKKLTYSREQIDKRLQKLAAEYERNRRDLEAVIGRLRHTWGVSKNPRSFASRAGRVASRVNTLRFMGMVTNSSIPDLARPVMKYGLLRTYRDGFVPFIRSLRELNFTPRNLRLMGAALDVTLHARATQFAEVGDHMVRGSRFEKGLDAMSGRVGLIGLFDYWTAAGKQISASVVNAYATDALGVVAGGLKASKKDVAKYTRLLEANGIDDDLARRIWAEMNGPGGSDVVGGQRWPNTEAWGDEEARRAFHAMVTRESDNTIVTPGVERPLMADANEFTRLLFQFKSFGMSSTTKTLIAGLQDMREGDMAFVVGGLISLALGALSYYTYAQIAGGTIKDRMNSAIESGDWGKFADEAINRSGLLGVGADLQSLFSALPATSPYVTFSGERTTRRGGGNVVENLFGPTFGDLANTGAAIATGIDDPTQATFHTVRQLGPFQNHFILRKLYDQIEQGATGVLPETRE